MLAFALILPALADAALAPCMGYFAYDSLPRPGAVSVPVDVVPAVLFDDGGCPEPTRFQLSLFRLDDAGETLAGSEETLLAGTGPLLVGFDGWDTLEGLEPDQSYILRVTPLDGSGELSEIAFSTGSATLVGYEGAPGVAIDSATASKSSGSWWLSAGLTVAPVSDPYDLSIVVVPHPDTPDQLLDAQVVSSDEIFSFPGWQADAAPDEICLTARQLDGALRVVGESEPACMEPEVLRNVGPSGRCDTGAAGLGLLPTLLGALGLRRKRS